MTVTLLLVVGPGAERLSGRADELASPVGASRWVFGHQLRTHRLDRLAGLFFL
jgi:hypothetical protein